MVRLSGLGNAGLIWIAIALLLLFWKSRRMCGITILGGLISQLLLCNLLLKNLVARPRPCWINDQIGLLIAVPADYSFPSGHTTAGFIAAVILLHYDRRIGIPALLLAAGIGFSRLYLYVHFPSDVLAGAVLGTLIGLASLRIAARMKT